MSDLRSAVVTWANWAVANKPLLPYLEHRPFTLYKPTASHLLYCDCSETSIWCLWMAGAPEPFPGAYSGSGNTESFLQLEHVALADVLPGDFVVYGEGLPLGDQHMAVVIEGGPDPLTMSHGQSSEPAFVRVSHGCPRAAQGRVTYVRCLPVDPPAPTPTPTEEDMKAYLATGSAGGLQIVSADCQSKRPVPEGDVAKVLLATGQFIDLRSGASKLDPKFVDSIPASS